MVVQPHPFVLWQAACDLQPTQATKRLQQVFGTRRTLSVNQGGQDDSDQLRVSGEVFINDTTCLTTVPSIGYVSGEASQQKTTAVTGDTSITQAVVDQAANSFNPGDVFTYNFTIENKI